MARGPYFFRPGGYGERLFGGDTLALVQRELNRVFDELDVSSRSGGQATAGQAAPAAATPLTIDLTETPAELKVRTDLPGVSEADIDVSLDEDRLTIRAERRAEARSERENVHMLERGVGVFTRSVRLPVAVDPDRVSARFEHGVLTVVLPKLQPADRTRKIQVTTAGGQRGGSSEGPSGSVSGLTGASADAGATFTQGDGVQGASPSAGSGAAPEPENAAKPGGAVHGYNE